MTLTKRKYFKINQILKHEFHVSKLLAYMSGTQYMF